MVVGDGHGYGSVVAEARQFNWNQLENKDLSVQEILQDFVENEKVSGPNTFDDGMSLSIVRVFSCDPCKICRLCAVLGNQGNFCSRPLRTSTR